MKLKFLSYCLAAATLVVVGSCSEKDVPISPTGSLEESFQTLSEIEITERELGITFFKQELTIFDKSGKNKATLVVASREKEKLDFYLDHVDISIEPVFERPATTTKLIRSEQIPDVDSENDYSGIILEFTSQELQKGAIGFTAHVAFDKEKADSDARTLANGYLYQTTLQSGTTWDEECFITTEYGIGFKFESKKNSCCFSTWKTQTFCIWGTSTCKSYWDQLGMTAISYDIDGPYKTRIVLDYDYFGTYSVTFFGHD